MFDSNNTPFWDAPSFTQMITILLGSIIVAIQLWIRKHQEVTAKKIDSIQEQTNGASTLTTKMIADLHNTIQNQTQSMLAEKDKQIAVLAGKVNNVEKSK